MAKRALATVRHLIAMKPPGVFTAHPSELLVRAALRLRANHIGALPVLESASLVGIISEGDLLAEVVAGYDLTVRTVEDAMTKAPLVVASERDSVETAMCKMTDSRVRHLPVMCGDTLVGIVSIGDIVAQLRNLDSIEIEYLYDYVRHAYW